MIYFGIAILCVLALSVLGIFVITSRDIIKTSIADFKKKKWVREYYKEQKNQWQQYNQKQQRLQKISDAAWSDFKATRAVALKSQQKQG